ncbi:MAG: LamG domain-containing protein [Bacilli bacterium]|nr:LamG domain-containing protein [Bacilli bacterium]
MKERGFTLVELLAVIIIIGIILAIAVPNIAKIIDKTRMDVYVKNENMLLEAVNTYMSKNIGERPKEDGDTLEITLNDLQQKGLMKTIKDPKTNTECNGYVIVTKVGNNYDYTPHLNCVNSSISNSTDDGLVLHYKFDDFQEPMENLLATVGVNATVDPTKWSHWEGSYWGIYEQYTDSNFGVVQKLTKNGAADANTYIFDYYPYTFRQNEVYTFSAMMRTNINFSKDISFYLVDSDEGHHEVSVSYNGSDSKTINFIANEWQYVFFTIKVSEDAIATGGFGLSMGSGWEGVIFEFAQPQFEKKDHATPFVNGTRKGIVKDYSGKNHNTSLQLISTPKWVESNKFGRGAYEFDGKSSYIDTNKLFNFNKEDSFSVSFWINTRDHSDKETAAAGLVGKGYWYDNNWDIFLLNSNKIRFECSGNPTRDGIKVIDTSVLDLGKWHYYVAVYDKGVMRAYLNSSLVSTDIYNGNGNFDGDRNVQIGMRYADATRIFKGLIDDVRIYNRALSPEEIKHHYDMAVYKK